MMRGQGGAKLKKAAQKKKKREGLSSVLQRGAVQKKKRGGSNFRVGNKVRCARGGWCACVGVWAVTVGGDLADRGNRTRSGPGQAWDKCQNGQCNGIPKDLIKSGIKQQGLKKGIKRKGERGWWLGQNQKKQSKRRTKGSKSSGLMKEHSMDGLPTSQDEITRRR